MIDIQLALVQWPVTVTASGIAIGGALWGLLKFMNRPRLLCGIPPSTEERRRLQLSDRGLGRPSFAYSFIHRRKYLAKRVDRAKREEMPESLRAKLLSSPSCRIVQREADGSVRLPVLFINNGNNAAREYIASIAFYIPSATGNIQLCGVETETLETYAYADPVQYTPSSDRNQIVSPDIKLAYSSYLPQGPHVSDHDALWAWGNLEAHTSEMVLLTMRVSAAHEFFVVITLDYAGRWLWTPAFIQACRVNSYDRQPAIASAE